MEKSGSSILLDDFAAWLTLNGRKPSTIKHLRAVLRLAQKRGIPPLSKDILNYISNLLIKGQSSSQINSFVCAFRLYANFCKDKEIKYDTGLHKIKFVKDRYKPRATMSDEEIESFLKLPRVKNTGYFRYKYWTTFFSIMAYTGMRTGEVSKLRVENVDFSQEIFYLVDTKTNGDRIVPIPPNIKECVLDWVNHVGKGYLFPSNRPEGHTSNVEWQYNFQTRIKRLGITRFNLTPYSLRHSYITEMLQTEGVNIFDVKNLVGHHDTHTTENYYHLTTKRLKAVVSKHPAVRKYTSPQEIFSSIVQYIDNLNLGGKYEVTKKQNNSGLSIDILFQKS